MKTLRSFTLLPVALFVACGGSSDFTSDGGRDEGIPFEGLPAEFAAAQCALFERCFEPLYHVFLTFEDCATRAEDQFRDGGFGALSAAVDAKTVKYDGKKAEKCLEAVAKRDCTKLNEGPLDECEAALIGTVPLNGDCEVDEECEGSRICEVAAACPGKCVERYGEGHECVENDQCGNELVCSEATSRCVRPAAEGAPCGAGIEPQCDGGLLCAGEDDGAQRPGTCRPLSQIEQRRVGEACSPSVGSLCEPGLSCVVDSLTPSFVCKVIPASGGSCGIGFPENCPVGEYCPISDVELALGVFEKSCEPLPQIGEACATRPDFIPGRCEPYSRCDEPTGRCLGLRGLGETCSSDELCNSGHCENGGCASVRACE